MFWKSNKLGKRCVDDTTTSIKVVTKKINGGYNGLDDRIRKFTKYWTELQKDPTLWT
jgi:predicted chitinase